MKILLNLFAKVITNSKQVHWFSTSLLYPDAFLGVIFNYSHDEGVCPVREQEAYLSRELGTVELPPYMAGKHGDVLKKTPAPRNTIETMDSTQMKISPVISPGRRKRSIQRENLSPGKKCHGVLTACLTALQSEIWKGQWWAGPRLGWSHLDVHAFSPLLNLYSHFRTHTHLGAVVAVVAVVVVVVVVVGVVVGSLVFFTLLPNALTLSKSPFSISHY